MDLLTHLLVVAVCSAQPNSLELKCVQVTGDKPMTFKACIDERDKIITAYPPDKYAVTAACLPYKQERPERTSYDSHRIVLL